MKARPVTLSLVIPVFNEASNLPELYRQLTEVLASLREPYEMIFVNDGSRDDSLEVLRGLHAENPCIRILDLSRNWGHQTALTVGLDHASGRAVITMDGDLQHPPEYIPCLVEKWREGYDIVQTVRQTSEADGAWLKRQTSQGFYKVFGAISKTDIPPGAADFRLMDRVVVEALHTVRERRRFLRGLIPWLGFKTAYVPYVAQPRYSGRPQYSFTRSAGLALSGVLSFSTVPLRISLYVGFALAALSAIYALYILYAYFFKHSVIEGWASLMLVVLILSSAQFIMQGVMGEYVATIVEESKQRPLYALRERIGFPDQEAV